MQYVCRFIVVSARYLVSFQKDINPHQASFLVAALPESGHKERKSSSRHNRKTREIKRGGGGWHLVSSCKMLVLNVLLKIPALRSRNARNIFVRYIHLNSWVVPLSRLLQIEITIIMLSSRWRSRWNNNFRNNLPNFYKIHNIPCNKPLDIIHSC